MITGTIIKNGTIKLVLTGSDEIDAAVLKQLNGATVTVITDNLRIGDHNISGGLIITQENERKTKPVASNPEPGVSEGLSDSNRKESRSGEESLP
jgi:hypothetical protein